MRRSARWLAIASLALACLVVGSVPVAAAGSHEGWVWHVMTVIRCAEPDCAGTELLPPWMSELRNPFSAVSDGHHGFYHRAKIVAIGRPGHPNRCDQTLFSKPFSGRCVVHDFGIGTIRPGAALPGYNDFWVNSETANFNDGPLVDDPFPPYPIDTYQLAAPGHYGTQQLIGSHPDGASIVMDVRRHHR